MFEYLHIIFSMLLSFTPCTDYEYMLINDNGWSELYTVRESNEYYLAITINEFDCSLGDTLHSYSNIDYTYSYCNRHFDWEMIYYEEK